MNRVFAVFAIACILCLSWPNRASASEPDPYRLDPQIRPISEELQLELNPAVDRYKGVARIQVEFGISANQFRFHGKELDLGRATLDGKELVLKAGEAGLLSATAADLIPAGKHELQIEFSNNYNRDGSGLYKVVTGGKPYLFTQMEAEYARLAFPCWDEPSFKIPWRITTTIPSSMEAVGNMPVAQTHSAGATKIVEFGRTPPMPSYLVELAVGEFEFLDVAGQVAPGRIVTVQAQRALGELAAREAPALLAGLEDYFGRPYPFPKLDHVGVPEFLFGAMENAGAITYKDSLLLFDSNQVSYDSRRRMIEVMTHEMAHMWFGDLVTMQWWDDVWLNESFATWMSLKMAGRVHPNDRFDLLSFDNVLRARAADTQPSVRAIRRPFRGDDNIMEAVDVLSYQKGHSILRMAECWLGEEPFRKGLREYFQRHQWANARAEDLWDSLGNAADPAIREIMRGYIEQPGLPALRFSRLPENQCRIEQHRYHTLIGTNVADETWHVPIVLRYGTGHEVKEFRCLLTNQAAAFYVPGLDQATWLCPNAGEAGYYTWSLAPDLTRALTGGPVIPLSDVERLGLLDAASLAVKAGSLPADRALDLLLSFIHDPVPEVKEQVVAGLTELKCTFADANSQPAFAHLIRTALRPMLEAIGFAPKPGEQPELSPLRSSLLLALGRDGEDPDVVSFCRHQALRQLSEPRGVDPGIASAVLLVTSWNGDAAWSDQLRSAYEHATAPDLRRRFLNAVTPFRNPVLARSGLEYLLSEAVRPTEILLCFRVAAQQPELARLTFEWVRGRYDRLKARIPEDHLPFLTAALAQGDSNLLKEGQAFFLDSTRQTRLTEIQFKKAAESVQLRAALQERYSAGVLRRVNELVQGQTERSSESPNFRILKRAAELIPDESHWNREDTRECPPGADKLSLYCALRQATEEVMGQSAHRTSAMEEVRRVIQERAAKPYPHRLMGYNNDPTTTLEDIHAVLRTAAQRLDARLRTIVPREFNRVLLLETNAETSASLSIGDMNEDGFPDLVLGKGRHWPLPNRVLLNDGTGHFIGSDLEAGPNRTYSAALADVNRDGHLDILVSNDRPDLKLIYLGDGQGHFKAGGAFGNPEWPTRYITLADLNGDGYPDLIVANRGGNSKRSSFVGLNDGNGHFPSVKPLEGTESATIIVAADLDADGTVDLFVPHRDGGQSMIYWNDGKGNFIQRTPVGSPDSAARAAAAADLNGDGRPDLVVGDERQGLFVYLNRGGREFSEPILIAGKRRVPYAVALADLNRDGKMDVIVGYREGPGSVYFNDGTGTNFREIPWNDGQGAVYGLAIADLDHDGWPDIAAARSGAPNAVWFSTAPVSKE